MKTNLPSWVSLLYVPGDDHAALSAATHSGADAIIIDLEDFVPSARKAEARDALGAHARALKESAHDVVVRINRRLDQAASDIGAAVLAGADAIMVTKTSSREHLELLDELIIGLERERGIRAGHTRLIAMIETAHAIAHLDTIARAGGRLAGITAGAEDLAAELGIAPASGTLAAVKQRLIVAAGAAGIIPMGHLGSVKTFGSVEHYTALLNDSRDAGFQAATCLTEAQVRLVNEVYTPGDSELAHARCVVDNTDPNGADPRVALAELRLARAARRDAATRVAIA